MRLMKALAIIQTNCRKMDFKLFLLFGSVTLTSQAFDIHFSQE